jgi:hypothetical protein
MKSPIGAVQSEQLAVPTEAFDGTTNISVHPDLVISLMSEALRSL